MTVWFITHPDVVIDPSIPVPDWRLSDKGLARMRAVLAQPWIGGIGSVWCSAERKARDGAAILADAFGLSPRVLDSLGENDRSATGYLPGPEFQSVADAFFANPEISVRGWERAVDAQRRIITGVETVIAASPATGDIAIVSHGGVGALLLCHLMRQAISRVADQPPNNGGNFFAFDRATRVVRHGWRPIDG